MFWPLLIISLTAFIRDFIWSITSGGGLRATGVTLKTLIEIAYGVEDFQITGAPGWFRSDRYDIMAKPERPEAQSDPGKTSDAERKSKADRLKERLRTLLAERFQLSVRRKTGERPVYLLTLAKNGHKLQEAAEGRGISRNRGMISGDGAPVAMLAKILSSTLGRPVLDRTGIDGKYKFKLEWTEESGGMKDKDGAPADSAAPDLSGPSIFTAIQQQLGLKLEPGKGPVEIIAITRAEKPSAN